MKTSCDNYRQLLCGIIFGLIAICVSTPDVAAQAPKEPLLWYTFDEASGNLLNDGTAGATGNASFAGSRTYQQSPLHPDGGFSIQFSDAYADADNVTDVNRNPGGPWNKRTVELWFSADSVSGRQVIFEEGGGTRGISIYLDGDTLYIAAWNRANDDGGGAAAPWGNSPGPAFVSTGPIVPGETYYLVAVLDATLTDLSGSLIGYLNGESFDSVTNVGPLWQHNPVVIGEWRSGTRYHDNSTGGSGGPFFGLIDEFKLWNTALSASEIRDNYNSGSSLRISRWVEVANP